MDRINHYFRYLENQDTLNAFYTYAELSNNMLVSDLLPVAYGGGAITHHISPGNSSVDIAPITHAVDSFGRLVATPNVTCTIQLVGGNDGWTPIGATGNPTPITGDGNPLTDPGVGFEYIISIYLYYASLGTSLIEDPASEVDSASLSQSGVADLPNVFRDARFTYDLHQVYTRFLDSFRFRIIRGATAPVGFAVPPANPNDGGILL